jgi:hypothetical protein
MGITSPGSAVYAVQVVHADRPDWADDLRSALDEEILALGLHRVVALDISPAEPTTNPAVTVLLGSVAASTDRRCVAAVANALADLRVVLPVVDDLGNFSAQVPTALHRLNGWEWRGPEGASRLARLVLEELGIEERQRRVFISHKREDGLLAAERLFEHLAKHGFDPFIDRFDIRGGADVQASIGDALEKHAFLLLLETPLAHSSEWVYDEVDYALSHAMGLHIVTWPGSPREVPGSSRLPRQYLTSADLETLKGYEVLTDDALDRTLANIEAAHALALVRRRRSLLRSIEDAVESKGFSCTPMPHWRLLVEGWNRRDLVAVSSRLPEVIDLKGLDAARDQISAGAATSAVLVHAARILREDRRELLEWAAADRPITLLPENASGGYW